MSEKILFTTGLEPRAYPTELPGPLHILCLYTVIHIFYILKNMHAQI